MKRLGRAPGLVCWTLCFFSATAFAAGARLYKSGPIQTTADGHWVWVANEDNDSVSRVDTTNDAVQEFVLPEPAVRDAPRGLSVREDGSEVWVACHDSDRVYVLKGSDGSVLAQIDLPWGSGPASVALSRDQTRALVALHRSASLAVLDVGSRSVTHLLKPVFWAPYGIAWLEDGVTAWVSHVFADGEDPFLTRIDFSGPQPKVLSRIIVKSTNPKQSSALAPPHNKAEGGYLTFRGHLAQVPTASGRSEVWIPTQYNNINEDLYSPDTTVQATLRHLDLLTRKVKNTNSDKVILTAVDVHDPASSNGATYAGPGWNAQVSGLVDLAFSADGQTAYVLGEQSNDLLILPVNTPAVKPQASPPLSEVPVGERPLGLAVSPAANIAYVANLLSRDVSVVDLGTRTELRRIAVTPVTGEPLASNLLTGAKLFHTSADLRLSANAKVACASCHPHGEHDGRTWDFEHLPGNHGPRSSMSLLGLSRSFGPVDPTTGWGQLHRSGDRDEIQDFEHTFQGVNMGGTGLLGAGVQPELGAANAGRSADLDALAAYVLSLPPIARSPYRAAGGALSEAAVRGATFFMGQNRASRPGDAGCAACHVPSTGFVDRKFHDVGQRRASSEHELNNRTPTWHVNTPTLIGVWTTPPYDGVASYANTILALLGDLASRAGTATPHGTPDGLVGRQLADLAEFVQSVDGNLTAAQVTAARDTTPPRILRVAPTSLTRVEVWFDEAVDPATAGNPANWRIVRVGVGDMPVTAALWSAQNGDHVTLTTALQAGTVPVAYQVLPGAAIFDDADAASGGISNALDPQDLANAPTFSVGSSLSVTLGASGYENITVPVHDAAMVGSGLSTWSHDSIWIFPIANSSNRNVGFVRFDWKSAFATATGVGVSSDLLDASFTLSPEWGDVQGIEIRRCLQSWSDPVTGGDFNSNPAGGPTWRDHAHPSGRWNTAGAQALGGSGASPADYNGAFDLAQSVDATVTMPAINERTSFGGSSVSGAFRFWFDNPSLDFGYALRVLPGASQEVKFERSEEELHQGGPVLTITYRLVLPPTPTPGGPTSTATPTAPLGSTPTATPTGPQGSTPTTTPTRTPLAGTVPAGRVSGAALLITLLAAFAVARVRPRSAGKG